MLIKATFLGLNNLTGAYISAARAIIRSAATSHKLAQTVMSVCDFYMEQSCSFLSFQILEIAGPIEVPGTSHSLPYTFPTIQMNGKCFYQFFNPPLLVTAVPGTTQGIDRLARSRYVPVSCPTYRRSQLHGYVVPEILNHYSEIFEGSSGGVSSPTTSCFPEKRTSQEANYKSALLIKNRDT